MSYFKKSFLHAMAVLGYLLKLEMGLGLALVHMFCYMICSLFNTVLVDKVSMPYFFPFQNIKQSVLLSSYLDNWWHHKL